MKNKYKTEQKKVIEDYLIENKDKFIDAKEILKYIKINNQTIGLSTIYRYLNYLEENNNVRVEIKDHTKYYQYITNECCNHFHIKCKKCGKTIHLECEELKHVNQHIRDEHRFNLDCNTIIYGTCDKCVG